MSLSGYEAQVSALLDDDERIAMVFFIACMPEDHPVIPGSAAFESLLGSKRQRKERWISRGYSSSPNPGFT